MDIQPAQPGDLREIQTLLRSCDLPPDDLTSTHLDHFLVVRGGNVLRGVGGLEPCGDVALLRSLAVAPASRSDGLGAGLVRALERRARRKGIGTLYLLTTTAADFFRARGYEPIDRDALPAAIQETEEATRLCPASATCMRKALQTMDESSA